MLHSFLKWRKIFWGSVVVSQNLFKPTPTVHSLFQITRVITVRYFIAIEKCCLILYFITAKMILFPNAMLLNLSLFIFMEHHYFGIFQLCLLGCCGWFLLVLVEIMKFKSHDQFLKALFLEIVVRDSITGQEFVV